LGVLRSSSAEVDWKGTIAEVWQVSKNHLRSRNANRRVLALIILEALLPFEWHLPDSDVQLSEEDMQSLMSLLSDADNTVRNRCLQLFCRIDTDIVSVHLDALRKAAEEGSRSQEDLSSLCIRICETLKCLCDAEKGNSFLTIYATTITSLFQIQSMSGYLDDQLIERISQDFQQASILDAAKGIAVIIKDASETKVELSPTYSLLISTLVCSVLEQSKDEVFRSLYRDILRHLFTVLPLVGDKNSALQEAMMISCIKLAALNGNEEAQGVIPTLSTTADSSESIMIKNRVKQLSDCISNNKLDELAKLMKKATLLSTLDRIEGFFSQSGYNKNINRVSHESKQRITPKPLHYDAYASPQNLDRATSPSVRKSNQPYNALPTPSQMRRQILAEQGKNAIMEQTIHQSIAQLTLGEDAVDGVTYTSDTSNEVEAKGDVAITENIPTAPREGVLF